MTHLGKNQWLVWGLAIYAVTTLVSMAVMSIGTGVALLAIIVGLGGFPAFWDALREELHQPLSRRYLAFASALAAACILSLIVAKAHPLSYGGKFSEVNVLKDSGKLWYLFWPLILAAGLRKIPEQGRATVLRAWILALGVVSLIGVIQHWTGWPRPQAIPGNEGRYHATLFLGHHLSVASILIFPFFVALDAWRKRSLRLPSAALAGIVVVSAATLFLTYSRMLWVALPAGVLVWVLWVIPPRRAAAVGALLLVIALGFLQVPSIQNRLRTGMGYGDRIALWGANLEFFRERPLTGVGWLHNQELSGYYLLNKTGAESVFSGHAHNNLINALGSTGALGTLAWLAWCAYVIWLAFHARRSREALAAGIGLVCAWLVFHLNGMTQVNFWEGKVTHQLMFVVAWSLLWASSVPSASSTKEEIA